MKNYYSILGIAKNATRMDIRKAYLQKAKLYHPDLNSSASAASKFKEVQEAYNTLYNPDKRREYDSGSVFSSGTATRYPNYDTSRNYRNYNENFYNNGSFEQQFKAETEWLRKQWQKMEEDRFKSEAENLRNLNNHFNFKVFDNFFSAPLNWLKYIFYFFNRILPSIIFPVGIILYLTRDHSGHGTRQRRIQIVYDSYGRAYTFDAYGRRYRTPEFDRK